MNDVQNVSWFEKINFQTLYEKKLSDDIRSVLWVPNLDHSNLTQWFKDGFSKQKLVYKSTIIPESKRSESKDSIAGSDSQWWAYEF